MSISILDTVASNNVLIREWLNGALIPLNICMIVIITYTVWRQTKFSWGWSKYPGASSACALWWIFIADLMRSILAWAILRKTNLNNVVVDTYHITPIATAAYMLMAVIALGATFRCIWCLTPSRGRQFAWIGALVFTMVFVLMAQLGLLDWVGDLVVTHG